MAYGCLKTHQMQGHQPLKTERDTPVYRVHRGAQDHVQVPFLSSQLLTTARGSSQYVCLHPGSVQ